MSPLSIAYVIVLGAGLGLGSAQWAVAHRAGVGLVQVGAWTIAPRVGARDVDPYTRAGLARGLHLPLGAGEGLELLAERDESGRPLDTRCRYRLSGAVPPSRGWSLTPIDPAGLPLPPVLGRGGLTDAEVVRDEAGGLAIQIAALPSAGNWLAVPLVGGFGLKLRLYDTPISSQAGELRADSLPRLFRLDCP